MNQSILLEDDERGVRKVIDALTPELRSYVRNDNGSYGLHGPLIPYMDLDGSDPAQLNTAFEGRKGLAEKFLADLRYRPISYLGLIEKPYRLKAFIKVREKLTDPQYWKCLEYVWSVTEYVHRDLLTWLLLFESERPYRTLLMNRSDRKYLEALPDTLTIYRGYQHGVHRHKMGLSWTLSKEKATWFAYRWTENGKPIVAVGQAKKADVFCYSNDRHEQEIVINPARIKTITTLKDIGPSPFGSE